MRSIFYLFAAVLLSNLTFAQQASNVIDSRVIESQLSDKSMTTSENKYSESYPLKMAVGDILLVSVKSSEFVVGIGIKDETGYQSRREDDPLFFKSIGSKQDITFKCRKTGYYYVVIYAKEVGATGKFKAIMYTLNNLLNTVTSSSPFCEKVKFIISNSCNRFAFIKSEKASSGFFSEPTLYLFPGTYTKILNDTYSNVVETSTDLESLKRKFDDLEKQLESCLVGHKKKVYTVDEIYSSEKSNFVYKTQYYLEGSNPADLNSSHILGKKVDDVILELVKVDADKYKIRLEIK